MLLFGGSKKEESSLFAARPQNSFLQADRKVEPTTDLDPDLIEIMEELWKLSKKKVTPQLLVVMSRVKQIQALRNLDKSLKELKEITVKPAAIKPAKAKPPQAGHEPASSTEEEPQS